jgi:hypothetical protein
MLYVNHLKLNFSSTNNIKMPLLYLLHKCFWWIYMIGNMFTFPTTTPTKNSKISSSKIYLFCFVLSTSIQLIYHLLKSILILFKPNWQSTILNTFTNQASFYNTMVKQIILQEVLMYYIILHLSIFCSQKSRVVFRWM